MSLSARQIVFYQVECLFIRFVTYTGKIDHVVLLSASVLESYFQALAITSPVSQNSKGITPSLAETLPTEICRSRGQTTLIPVQ